jgi:3-hydroxybutyryl-CoA dehydrogenase
MKIIAVIGAGTMGNGIHTFAQSGFTVKLIDVSEKSLERNEYIAANLDRMVSKGTITEEDKAKQ